MWFDRKIDSAPTLNFTQDPGQSKNIFVINDKVPDQQKKFYTHYIYTHTLKSVIAFTSEIQSYYFDPTRSDRRKGNLIVTIENGVFNISVADYTFSTDILSKKTSYLIRTVQM